MKFKHLALTGIPGVGKTTYVRTLVQKLSQENISCIGFVTEEVKEKGQRIGFDIVTLDGKRGILSRKSVSSVSTTASHEMKCVGQYIVDVESFESLVLPLLTGEIPVPKNGILVIDEIGKMELFSGKFIKKIKDFLASANNQMLVTIPVAKGRPIPLVEDIRNHEDFKVIEVTKLNRNDKSKLEELMKFFTSNV